MTKIDSQLTLAGKRLIVVDDEMDILETVEDLLQDATLDFATSYEQAQILLTIRKYDAAVLDIMGVRGFDLLKEFGKKLPCVMLTGKALSTDALETSIKGNAALYLPNTELGSLDQHLAQLFVDLSSSGDAWRAQRAKFWSSFLGNLGFKRWFGKGKTDDGAEAWSFGMARGQYLRGLDWLAALPETDLDVLVEAAEQVAHGPETPIFGRETEPPPSLCIVRSGEVQALAQGRKDAVRSEGDSIGAERCADYEIPGVRYRSKSSVQLLTFPWPVIERRLDVSRPFREAMAKQVVRYYGAEGATMKRHLAWLRRLRTPLLRVAGRTYRAMDVLLAAEIRNELRPLIEDHRRTVTAEHAQRYTDELPKPAEVQKEAKRWRTERGLDKGGEAWLEKRSLDAADVDAFCRRRLCRARSKESDAVEQADVAEILETLYVDLACQGQLDHLAKDLAKRAHLHAEWKAKGETLPTRAEVEAAVAGQHVGVAQTIQGSLPLDLAHLREVEALFVLKVQNASDHATLAELLETERPRLKRVRLEEVIAPSPEAAELAKQALAGSATVEDAASRAGTSPRLRTVFAEDLAPELLKQLGPEPGRTAGPVREGASLVIARVAEVSEPSLEDGPTFTRLRERMRRRLEEGTAADGVEWLV